MIFDNKLTWRPHLQDVALRCRKKLNILKVLAHSKFCQNIHYLLSVYKALIRSIIDYACEAYDSASDSVKNILNSIQYDALRICSRAKRGTSLKTLQAEFGEMPLDLRREMLSIRLRKRVDYIPNHPMKESLKKCWQFDLLRSSNSREPFGLRTQNLPAAFTQSIEFCPLPSSVPFWTRKLPEVSTELSNSISKNDNTMFLRQCSLELIHTKWFNYLQIYTDGSKAPDKGKVSAAFYVPEFKYIEKKRMQDESSVYRAELAAIILALNWLHQLPALHTGAVILSDSLSSLLSLKTQKDDNFITEILILCNNLYLKGINVSFEWIPGHCDISGNEMADKAAKDALQNPLIDINNKLNKNELNHLLKTYCNKKWQCLWEETNSPLRDFQHNVCSTYICHLKDRRGESIIHCLRMGNIGLNNNLFKINLHDTGLCNHCNTLETVEHFLCSCPKYIIERSMLLAESDTQLEDNILSLLNSSDTSHQKALVSFVQRTQRFLQW